MDKKITIAKEISIVVPTKNRIEQVQRLFFSLNNELKTFDGMAEVIIIDNSDPKNSSLIADMCKKYGYKFKFLGGSISESRNYGRNIAQFSIILFIDSDCEAMPGLLQEHLQSYSEDYVAGVLGLTEFTGKRNWVWRAIEKTPFLIAFSFANRMNYAPWGPCANISFRKDVLEKVGGFKTKFPFDYSGEDVDIGLRVNESGYKIKTNPNARVTHTRETWSEFWNFCKKIFRWGKTDFHILKEHPHLSFLEFPKFSTIFFFFLILFAIFILAFGWKMTKPLVIWLLCTPILETFLKTYKSKFRGFFFNYLSFWLIFVFELGQLYETLKNGSLSMLYKKIKYGEGHLIFEWSSKVVEGWSYIISFIIILFTVLLKR